MPRSEAYTVVARRYRPRQFADLVGQEPVARALANALESGRVAHAYLFTGSRGVGKTSCARILAKALNCERSPQPTPTPCDQCPPCRAIGVGEDIDVIEVDGASNRGIDEVRSIRQNVHTRPTRSRYKVYIVDEVHMLTAPAFNALLKTLEEPPPHVKFIFATTEVQKIPITILSRCQRFDFAGIGTKRIVDRLREIVRDEGREADDEALALVARRAGGSMRDGQSLLDQLLAFSGDRLTAEAVHQLLGTAGDERVTVLAAKALGGEPLEAVRLLNDAAEQGLQLGELLDQLIEYWRGLMLLNCSEGSWSDLPVADAHREEMTALARSHGLDTILAGLDILTAAKSRTRGSPHGQVLLEMALIRVARLGELLSVAELAERFHRPAESGPTPPPAPVEDEKKNLTAVSRNGTPHANGKPHHNGHAADAGLTAETLPQVWAAVLAKVGQFFRADLAKAGEPAILGPTTLELRFPFGYKNAYESCSDPEKIEKLAQGLHKVCGRNIAVKMTLRPDGGPAESPTAQVVPDSRPEDVPLVAAAMKVLQAKVMKAEPDFGRADRPASHSPEPED